MGRLRTAWLVPLALAHPACAPDVAESDSTRASTTTELTSVTSDEIPSTMPTSSVSGDHVSAPAAVFEVLNWDAPLIGGGTIDMRELAGQHVLLWFWAPY